MWHAARALPTVAPSRCLAAGTQSVGKRTGGMYPKGTLRKGASSQNNKNIKIFLVNLKVFKYIISFFIQLFPIAKITVGYRIVHENKKYQIDKIQSL
ncbi:hypothetical protein BPP43_07985 [Brachyspira pilosicoli P43/6/78]|uniref:Uncharacterized protein n=1 Tax=Brachyspira pilosicoli P43/6/78 TaxID=1042417 RepID=A0A3B6VXS2_BRAPL|nr:hypothetical protein BPP43_07985 [Brachyspira pilosicoli P43/6/78]